MTTNPSHHDLKGRTDKPCSSLDKPKYVPYADGKGQLDVGMKPIEIPSGVDEDDVIFDIDKFWPYYMNMKHWLFDNSYDVVYQDINKKRLQKTHFDLAMLNCFTVSDLKHDFGRSSYGSRWKNPNWDDWTTIGDGDRYFEKLPKSGQWDSNDKRAMHYNDEGPRYQNFFGGPVVDMGYFSPSRDKYGLLNLARSVQEDLCILRRRPDGWNLRAAAVCFPSYWNLAEKMGKPLQFIHGPVPQITSEINDVITSKLDALDEKEPVERFNWTLTPDMILHQPNVSREAVNIPNDDVALNIFIRVERQTMTMLRTGDILFTIRTYLNPISSIFDSGKTGLRWEWCRGLHDSILNTSPKVLEYRGIDRFASKVLRYLDKVCSEGD